MNFFNVRLVYTIINGLKFFIVIANSFVFDYPVLNGTILSKGQIAVGAVALIWYGFGYLFYVFLRCWLLDHFKNNANNARASPFLTYRYVYYGNKSLKNL